MFYKFLDVRILPVITCNTSLLKMQNIKVDKNKREQAKQMINHFFYYPYLMETILCYVQLFIYLSETIDIYDTPKLNPNSLKYIQNSLERISTGQSGNVHKSLIFKFFNVVIKSPKQLDSFTDILHEYMVGVHGINNLRYICPNFCYTFALYNNATQLGNKIILEHIKGETIKNYIIKNFDKNATNHLKTEFLIIWLQLILALEYSQQTIMFTHYDLHGENIMIRKLDSQKKMVYHIYNEDYCISNVNNIVTILDYGHASIYSEKYKGIIGKGFYQSYPMYGMYCFYIPGADLFKICVYIWIQIAYKTPKENTMGKIWKNFFKFILLRFFQIQTTHPREPYYMSISTLQNNFFDGTKRSEIFLSPFDFLQLLKDRETEIKNIFNIDNYPWIITENNKEFKIPLISNEDMKKRINQSFLKVLCCNLYDKKLHLHELFSYSWDEFDLSNEDLIFLDSFIKEYVAIRKPKGIQIMNNFNEILNYINDNNKWDKYINIVNKILTHLRLNKQSESDYYNFFNQNKSNIIYFYRLYICFKSYQSYLHSMFKIPKNFLISTNS